MDKVKDCIGFCYECKSPIGYPSATRGLEHLDGTAGHAPHLANAARVDNTAKGASLVGQSIARA